MSDVWLARDVDLGVPLIVKTLKPDLAVSAEERVRRMVTEARLMARIPSPQVVRALGVGIHAGTPYMAQEYVDGVDLNELDHARRDALGHGLPLWFVCEAAAQIARGLHAAHQYGVLHRDLKPSNLFGSPELGTKLGDFGVAVAQCASARSRCEQSGTLRFMAPEVMRGEAFDRRADVYGLGATAYDLRYGTPPFPNPTVLLDGPQPVPFPRPVSPEDAAFQHVLARMLAYDPDARASTLSEPYRQLQALALGAPRPAAPLRGGGAVVFGGTRIVAEAGDLTRVTAHGIVASANFRLEMRSGVGEALRRAGGDELERQAMAQGEQPLGACVVTGPGALRCRQVLHAVSAWEHASCVGRATQRALLAAERLGLRTLAFSALGTGAAGIATEACAAAMVSAVRWHLALGSSRLEELRFVLYDAATERIFLDAIDNELLGQSEPLDPGLPHVVATRPDGHVAAADAPTVAGLTARRYQTPRPEEEGLLADD